VAIHEIDQGSGKQHAHWLLVPLPISHFFEQRMVGVGEQGVRVLRQATSQYTLEMAGSLLLTSIEKLKERWWYGTFVSCLGWNELVLFEVGQQGSDCTKIEVFGRKNGKIVMGVIEFLSFFLAG
jgi:hypothetical protein